MPSRSELPSKLNRTSFCNALTRVGFRISTKGGKGSHFKATWSNEKAITIPSRLDRDVLYYVVKEIEKQTGISWEMIAKHLR